VLSRSESQRETLDEVRGVVRDVLDKGPTEGRESWRACAEAGLLGLAAPESYGGDGLGLAEVGVLLHEAGSRAVDLPIWETLVCGLLPITAAGTPEQQQAILPAVISGDLLLVPAFNEPGFALPREPATRLRRDGDRLLLSGTKVAVPSLDGARLLVSASYDGRPVVVGVDPEADGVTRTGSPSSRGVSEATCTFDDTNIAESDVLGGAPGSDAAAKAAAVTRDHAIAGLLLLGDGLVCGARDLTAGYVKERTQFGRALAEFQAVAVQIADVYVTSRMVALAAESAAWRVGAGLDAADDLAVGAYWFCAHAPAALQTCHHLHGGMGVDETYPLHRYFSRVKDVDRLLGGTAQSLAAVPTTETSGKNLELSEEQRAFKAETRSYFEGLVSREDRVEMMTDRHGPAYHRIIKQMGSDGWMGVGWPVEYGGKGMGEIEQQVFANEAARNDVHLPSVTLQTVGPTLQAFGTQEQKDTFLGAILTGDVHFAIGYSEADAGTDLASLRTSARREGDEWVVNGQKMWTTGGHAADYIWLAVRTDPDAPPHKGISVLIVDTRDPGYSWTPIITCDGSHHVNATYYNDVRVPASMLVGEENQGWRLITTQLNHERVMLGPAGRLEGLRDEVIAWAEGRTTTAGEPLLDQPDLRDVLARVTAAFRVNELLNWQVAEAAASGSVSVADASASKVFSSDVVQSLGLELEEAVARYADPADPETAHLMSYLDATCKRNLVLTFGGGVNEIQRELISMFGLGLPRVPR
jgi:alkylation response protein AidB-like acyl-CoA dehydrogenase